jgi:hypothetical protein
MSNKTHYSAEEWNAISAAPVAAALLITRSDSSPAGIAKEALAVAKAIMHSAYGDAPEIVRALAENVRTGRGRPELPAVPSGDRTQTKTALIGALRTAVGAVQRQSPEEVEAYKAWLASVAAKVAQASKEGGFLGIGGALVSTDEQDTLQQLVDVLCVSARQPAAVEATCLTPFCVPSSRRRAAPTRI